MKLCVSIILSITINNLNREDAKDAKGLKNLNREDAKDAKGLKNLNREDAKDAKCLFWVKAI